MNGPWGQGCFAGWGDLLFMVGEEVLSLVFCGELELLMVHEKVFCTGVSGEASTVHGLWQSILHWC